MPTLLDRTQHFRTALKRIGSTACIAVGESDYKPVGELRNLIGNRLHHVMQCFFIGNTRNLNTFSSYTLPAVHFIKNNGYAFLYDNPRFISSRSAPNKFLYLSSGGQVHKGLDLLLEVFSKNLQLQLFICSPFEQERDFCKAYFTELYTCSNIYPVGFLSVASKQFYKIAEECSYIISPSCAEGLSGSVLTGMSAGLIPIISKECGLEEDEAYYFFDSSLECIEATLNDFAMRSSSWLSHASLAAQSIVREQYSERAFIDSVEAALVKVIATPKGG